MAMPSNGLSLPCASGGGGGRAALLRLALSPVGKDVPTNWYVESVVGACTCFHMPVCIFKTGKLLAKTGIVKSGYYEL